MILRPHRALIALIALALLLAAPMGADAQSHRTFVHVVRPSETLASIAHRYYGDPRRETILVEENGLTAQGGTSIVVGMRLLVPYVTFHRVREDETWNGLAEYFYGSTDRAFLLISANDGTAGEQPDAGAELLVPYPLRHVAEQNETLRRVATQFYGDDSAESVRVLRRFNRMRGIRPNRGQVVLVPLADLTLSDEGRQLIEAATGDEVSAGDVRMRQQAIDSELPVLREHVRRGRFAEAVSLGNRLLGAGRLTGNQVVTIQRELGTAYVALDRTDLAVQAFRAAVRRQADLELDSTRTSPTVLRAFEEARDQEREAAAAAAERAAAEEATDGGAATADAGTP
jgi:hypothetical protein